eukprot:5605427-Pyramimonas_sp.AAC.3
MQIQNLMDTAVKGSLVGGVLTIICLNLAVGPILKVLNCDGIMVAAVHAYVTVRALGAPAFLISNFLEGCLIGMRDAVTPLKLVGVAMREGRVSSVPDQPPSLPATSGCAVAITVGQIYCTSKLLKVLDQRGLLTVRWAAPFNWEHAKTLCEVRLTTTATISG